MANFRVLVLGNDPQINAIEFDRLESDVMTLGVNRIWLKHIPNYFFFNDVPILQELEERPDVKEQLMKRSVVYSSDYLYYALRSSRQNCPAWIRIHNRLSPRAFPDSVTTALRIFSKNYKKPGNYTFYLAGVSLTWQEPSHFWKELNYSARNRHDSKWYSPRFDKMFNNFVSLKNAGLNFVSVHPNSALNKVFRYENIENLYRKGS